MVTCSFLFLACKKDISLVYVRFYHFLSERLNSLNDPGLNIYFWLSFIPAIVSTHIHSVTLSK